MCGLDCTMNVILDTHGRVIDCIFGSHPEAHREAIRRFNAIYAYDSWVEEQGQADIVDLRRLRADRPPLLPHRLGLHVGRPRAQGRRHDHLHEPVARRLDRDRRLPRLRADGPDEAVHAADDRELPARAARHPQARDPDVGRLHLGADLRGDDAQAPDGRDPRGEPRAGGRHRARRDDLARRGVRRAMERHGADAKVAVLPYARYQLPRNAVRMASEEPSLLAHAGV